MSLGDLTRINTNIQSLQALNQLQKTNAEMGIRQLRLATGSRLNRAEDDSASYSIAKKLEAKIRGQAQALANIGDAKSMLTVGEGALNTVMDILQTMKEKVIQAANDTLSSDERTSIKNYLNELSAELQDTLDGAEFNGTALFGSATVMLQFQVGASSSDTFSVSIDPTSASGLSVASTDLIVASAASAAATLDNIDNAIKDVADRLAAIGDAQTRLTFKQDNLSTSMTNYEAARSRIADADFAKEQMEIVKLQILQQTGTAALAQANAAPQAVLSLF